MLNNAVNIDGRWAGQGQSRAGQGRSSSRGGARAAAGMGRERRAERACCVGVGKFDKLDEMAASLSLALSHSFCILVLLLSVRLFVRPFVLPSVCNTVCCI